MAAITINKNITLDTTVATTVIEKAQKNLLLMLKEEGRFIPSHEEWVKMHGAEGFCIGVFADEPTSWEEEAALLNGTSWMDIFLSRLDTTTLRSYVFWGLGVIFGGEDYSGQKWPDSIQFFLPNYGEVSSATDEERKEQKEELEGYLLKH